MIAEDMDSDKVRRFLTHSVYSNLIHNSIGYYANNDWHRDQ